MKVSIIVCYTTLRPWSPEKKCALAQSMIAQACGMAEGERESADIASFVPLQTFWKVGQISDGTHGARTRTLHHASTPESCRSSYTFPPFLQGVQMYSSKPKRPACRAREYTRIASCMRSRPLRIPHSFLQMLSCTNMWLEADAIASSANSTITTCFPNLPD